MGYCPLSLLAHPPKTFASLRCSHNEFAQQSIAPVTRFLAVALTIDTMGHTRNSGGAMRGVPTVAQGVAVRDAIHHHGLSAVQSVRVGKFMEIEVDGSGAEAEAQLHEICRDLLSNPVIEDYELIIEG